MAEHEVSLCHRVGAGAPLLQVRPGGGVVAQEEQGHSERVMCLQATRRVGSTLGEPHELFPKLPRDRKRPLAAIEPL
jgi:hypothetical protein